MTDLTDMQIALGMKHNEIERLTRERDEAQKLAQFECVARHEAYAEWDRLRAALDTALKHVEDRGNAILEARVVNRRSQTMVRALIRAERALAGILDRPLGDKAQLTAERMAHRALQAVRRALIRVGYETETKK